MSKLSYITPGNNRVEVETELTRPGSAALNSVTAEEKFGVIHRTKLTLSNVPVAVTSVGGQAGVGGTKIFDFPAGKRVAFLGGYADLSIQASGPFVDPDYTDFTDATPEGDIGIGTLAPANANALGTDATDDNFMTAAGFTMSAYNDPSVLLPSEASAHFNGVSTPVPMYVNVLVDAADIDDGVTSEVLVSGTVEFSWIELGNV